MPVTDPVSADRSPLIDVVLPGAPGVRCSVSTRAGGVSEGSYASLNLGLHVGDESDRVIENRRRAAAAMDLALDDLIFMDQTHTAHVAQVSRVDRGRGSRAVRDAIAATDGLVTREDVALVVMVADCSPIVLADPAAEILAVAHAGWRGLVAGIVTETVSTMLSLGADRSRIVALIGPTIDQATFEVGAEVVDQMIERLGSVVEPSIDRVGARPHVDLAGACAIALHEEGIVSDRLSRMSLDTSDDRFFSDRRARPCGRFAMIAQLHGANAQRARRA